MRIFMTYRSFWFFAAPGTIMFTFGLALASRYLAYFLAGRGAGHVQSVILAALLLGSGITLILVGLLADLISVNRKLLEHVDDRIHRLDDALTVALRAPEENGVAPAEIIATRGNT